MRHNGAISLVTRGKCSRCVPIWSVSVVVVKPWLCWHISVRKWPQTDWLRRLAVSRAEALFCRGWPWNRICFSGILMPAKCYLWVFCIWRWLVGALVWYEVVLKVFWVWLFLEGTLVQDKSTTTFALPRSLCMSYKVVCRWILLVFSLEMPRRG